MTYQKLQIIGHVGRDPELKYTQSGQSVTDFSVATNRSWTGNDGQRRDETTWFRVTVWGRQAETCNQYVSKGKLVMCEGRLAPQINIWTDREGMARASYEMTADSVRFLGGRADEGGYQGGSSHQAPAASSGGGYQSAPSAPPASAPSTDEGIQEDEIPF